MGIKIAIGGKGGVGKTTVCAIWAQLFAKDGFDVLVVDADPDANLCSAFGISSTQSPEPLINMKQMIAERTGSSKDLVAAYFRLNPKVSDLPDKYAIEVDGLKLLVLGNIKHAGAGCACPEGSFLRAMLSHMILERDEVVLVDMAAGVEFMGRASIMGIDAMVVVTEPGSRSIETALNIAAMAKELGIKQVAAIINKIIDTNQIETIKSQLTTIPLLATVDYNQLVQQADLYRKGVYQASSEVVDQLQQAKKSLMDLILSNADSGPGSKEPDKRKFET